jgi:hypothetical protein
VKKRERFFAKSVDGRGGQCDSLGMETQTNSTKREMIVECTRFEKCPVSFDTRVVTSDFYAFFSSYSGRHHSPFSTLRTPEFGALAEMDAGLTAWSFTADCGTVVRWRVKE